MMNPDEKSKVKVKSRAYELFYKYSDFLGQSSLDASQHYTIHKHFAEHPDLEFIGFWWDNSLKTMTWPPKGFDIKAYPNYNRFLQSLFMDIAPVPSPLSDNISGYSHNYFEFITSVGVGNTKLARSFSAFNLGIPGFESWGTLMVEGIKLGFEEVRKLFYEESGGDFEETALLREIKNILFILKKIDYD